NNTPASVFGLWLATKAKVAHNAAFPPNAPNRHRGSGRPLSPATPPDMRVRIRRFRGLRNAIEQARETKRVEIGDGKRVRQGRTVRQMPGAVRAARRLCGQVPTDPQVT